MTVNPGNRSNGVQANMASGLKRKPGSPRVIVAWLHRWIGAVLGIPFVILGITGTILVFEDSIDRNLNPHLSSGPVTRHVSPDQMMAAARAFSPSLPEPTLIRRALPEGGPAYVDYYIENDSGHEDLKKLAVDPLSGEALELRDWGTYTASWIYYLHMAFRAGEGGEYLVGIIGAVLSVMLIGGLWLWWPRRGQWRVSLKPGPLNGWRATSYRWHRVFGVYAVVLLLVVSVTGAGLVYFDPVVKALRYVVPMAYPYETRSTASDNGSSITADTALARALDLYPKARWERIVFPEGKSGAWLVMLYAADESGTYPAPYPDISVWVDQYSSEIVGDFYATRDARIGDTIMWSLFPLHNGSQLGLTGRLLIAFSGVIPMFFLVTGLISWVLKPRRVQAAKIA